MVPPRRRVARQRDRALPDGDNVQTVEPWTPPDAWADLNTQLLNRILDDIDAGMPDGNRYSNAPNAGERAAWQVIAKHAPGKAEGPAREIINTWVKNGVLVVEEYENPGNRHPAKDHASSPPRDPEPARMTCASDAFSLAQHQRRPVCASDDGAAYR